MHRRDGSQQRRQAAQAGVSGDVRAADSRRRFHSTDGQAAAACEGRLGLHWLSTSMSLVFAPYSIKASLDGAARDGTLVLAFYTIIYPAATHGDCGSLTSLVLAP